jgi:glyoxylase-like metal-dependent hydrolase (beta-lactamase superfamily II)
LNDTVDSAAIRTIADLHLTPLEPLKTMSEGIFGLRLPLPFVLNHVNLWLMRDAGDWTLIDTGIDDQPTRAFWGEHLEGGIDQRPIERLIATHFHPDHMGLAGWLVEQTGAEFLATRTEWLLARALSHDISDAFVETGRRFDHRAGLDADMIEARARRGNLYRTRVCPPPSRVSRLQEGDCVTIAGTAWRVLIGRGHAPEMISLYSAERGVLIAADQILQKISPNISVWPAEPYADPLNDYIESLDAFRDLPETTLVLPSHGQPFEGLHARIDQLIAHHQDRLERAIDAAADGRTGVEIMPALFDRELDAHQLGFALGEALAHLNYLVNRGSLIRSLEADGVYRYARA